MLFSNKVYDTMKWVVLIFLPALSVLLGTLLPVIGMEDVGVKAILVIVGGIETFLGTCIGVSTGEYNNIRTGGTDE